MDTRITGIINPGDTKELKEWLETQFGSKSKRMTDISDMRVEISLLKEKVDGIYKKVENIEHILEKISD